MQAVKIFIMMLAAVRTGIYMRCFYSCIGKYKVSKKIVTAAFAVLWALEGFILSISHIGAGIMLMDFCFLLAEIPFLSALSFCYQGRTARRLFTAVSLSLVYWVGKWSIAQAFFSSATDSRRYLAATAASVSLLCIFEAVLEKSGKSRQERERGFLEQQIRIYENQFGIIRQSQHNIRALKHDMKHHIKMLADMVSGGENEAALDYLAAMGAFMENSEEYVVSGNEKIDSILNYMIARAENLSINVSWSIQLPEHLEIPAFDINVILSNLFENALNALAGVPEPSLYILMKYDRGVLCISTQNNCSGENPAPAAADAKEHGFGLKNIQKTAEKYHGSLTAAAKDGVFYASVILFLEDTAAV